MVFPVQQSLANTLAPDYFIKRIVFARRDQLFDPQCLPEDLPPSATLHDIPVEPTSVKRGEPLARWINHKQGGAVKEILQNYRYPRPLPIPWGVVVFLLLRACFYVSC